MLITIAILYSVCIIKKPAEIMNFSFLFLKKSAYSRRTIIIFFSPKRPPLFFMVLEDTVTIKFTFTFYDHSCAINGGVGGAGLK